MPLLSRLKSLQSFKAFLFTQFLGVFNDNAFKIMISFMAISQFTSDPERKNLYLSLAGAISIIPFVLFAGYAGYISDRYHKTKILVLVKALEIGAMGVALLLFATTNNLAYFLIALFLMGAQSAFFSPAKYSIIPEIVPANRITNANSQLTMLTYLAIIFGTVAGGSIFQYFSDMPIYMGLFLVFFAMAGSASALLIPHSPYPGNPQQKFHKNPLHQVFKAIPYILGNRPLKYAVLGSFLFWTLSGFLYYCLLLLGKDVLNVSETKASALFSILGLGIAFGGLLAGIKAGSRTRAFLCPIGATIMGIGCALVGGVETYKYAAVLMAFIGIGCGLFIVPVVTTLQKATTPEKRGQIIASSSFFDIGGVVVASGVNYLLHGVMAIPPHHTAAMVGTGILIAVAVSIIFYRDFYRNVWRSIAAGLLLARYNIQIIGEVPETEKGMLIVANHQSYLDGILLAWLLPRGTKFLVLPSMFKMPVIGWMLRKSGAIPFGGTVGQNKHGIQLTRKTLAAGGKVCVFAEGTITRTGNLRPFRRGTEALSKDLDIDILPIYVHGLFGGLRTGSKFSFSGQKFFTKWSGLQRRRLTLKIGDPLPANTSAWELRNEIALLGSLAMRAHVEHDATLAEKFLDKAQASPFQKIIADSTGANLNYMKLAVGARLLAKHLEKFDKEEKVIGILMPGTVGAVLANLASAFSGRTVVNLNFSLGKEVMENAIEQAGIQRIISSKLFLKKLGLEPKSTYIYLEDFKRSVTSSDRIKTLLSFWLIPSPLLKKRWLSTQAADDIATIQFSSGSTAEPKGVCLSNRHILCNVSGFGALFQQIDRGTLLAVLPLFHAFGYTVCQWYCLLVGNRVFFHPNPLEYKKVAEYIQEQEIGTVVATPTFAVGYARSGNLETVRAVICGGEKLAPKIATILQEKLPNAHILEGYGASELGPVVACNVPDFKNARVTQIGTRPGSVGMPIPGVAVKAVDAETQELLPAENEGLIYVHSPARMHNYLNKPELTAEVLKTDDHNEDWYNTGDIGKLDADGFLFLTDRQSRFSKIGGEMVPHGRIEVELQSILDHQEVAVVADANDKLHVIYADNRPAKYLVTALKATNMPALWQPKPNNYHRVEELPRMATGKLDLKQCKKLVVG